MRSFTPMLADPPHEKHPLVFPFLASPKLDGIRCVITPDGPRTRSLKPIPNKELAEKLATLPVGLDGELMGSGKFQDTTSSIMSHDGDSSGVIFHVFDQVDSFVEPTVPFCLRLHGAMREISRYRERGGPARVAHIEHTTILNMDVLNAYEAHQLNAGHEGVMLRKVGGLYKFGRATPKEQTLLKVKRFEDTEGEVVGVYERNENTNEQQRDERGYAKRSSAKAGKVGADTFGGLIVKLDNTWSEKTVKIATGDGWTDEERDRLWAIRDTLPGKIAKYKFQRDGSKDKPRIPIFLAWRYPEDMS